MTPTLVTCYGLSVVGEYMKDITCNSGSDFSLAKWRSDSNNLLRLKDEIRIAGYLKEPICDGMAGLYAGVVPEHEM